jgi:hypothetical protein
MHIACTITAYDRKERNKVPHKAVVETVPMYGGLVRITDSEDPEYSVVVSLKELRDALTAIAPVGARL